MHKWFENDLLGSYIGFDLVFQSVLIDLKITTLANLASLISFVRSNLKSDLLKQLKITLNFFGNDAIEHLCSSYYWYFVNLWISSLHTSLQLFQNFQKSQLWSILVNYFNQTFKFLQINFILMCYLLNFVPRRKDADYIIKHLWVFQIWL